jgi:hypothetical protein
MKILLIAFTFLFFLIPFAHAIMPPMPEVQAIEGSNVVVDAETIEVTKMGAKKDSGCMVSTPYQAKLKVLKIHKGTPKDVLILHYTHKKLKERCSGQPFYGTYKGQKNKYFLRCADNENCGVVYEGMIEVMK